MSSAKVETDCELYVNYSQPKGKIMKKRIISPSHHAKLEKALLKANGLNDYIQCTQCNKRFHKDDTFKTHMLFKHGRFISSMEKAREMMLCTFKRLYE